MRTKYWLEWIVVGTLLTAAAVASDSPTNFGEKVKLEGVVVETAPEQFLIQNHQGVSTQVRLRPSTEIEEKRSNFLRQPLSYGRAQIVTGLRVVVKGRFDEGGVLWANSVRFTQDALKTARVVDASLTPVGRQLTQLRDSSGRLSGQVEDLNAATRRMRGEVDLASSRADQALHQANSAHHRIDGAENRLVSVESRFAALGHYQLGETAVVYFEVGKSELLPGEQKKLDRIVEVLGDGQGALIEVTGFASADGPAAFNRRLSERRAQAVIQYLAEQRLLPLRLFVNPHGFGELLPAADNATLEGRKLNRRVEVRILLDRGLRSKAEVTG